MIICRESQRLEKWNAGNIQKGKLHIDTPTLKADPTGRESKS